MSSPYLESPNQDNLRNLGKIVLLLYLIVGFSLFFWGLIRANSILARADNPRLLEEEFRIQRGAILDRSGKVLAENKGSRARQLRNYPIANIGPAVGFYSIVHGTAGAESGFDEILRSDPPTEWEAFWQNSLHLPQYGRDVKLALDLDLQLSALTAMDKNPGAVLLLELEQNDSNRVWIRALVSNPGYDANLLDEQFDILGSNENAPLLNRVTQGQYQPGLLLQPFILAAALDQGLIQIDDVILDPNRAVELNGEKIQCLNPPPASASWSDVLKHLCPGPMIDLADQLGPGGLDPIFAAFGFDHDPIFEIDTTTTTDDPTDDSLLAGIGQENLSITPLQIGLAMSALVNNGNLPYAQIGLATQDNERKWQPWTLNQEEFSQAVSPTVAAAMIRLLPQENDIIEHNPLVLSGPNESTNGWYSGILTTGDSVYIAVVVLEGSKDEEEAKKVGRFVFSELQEIEKRNDT